jgi:hypothetical protein
MLHKEFWGMLFLAFVAWVFLAGNPDERIKNVCRPIGWSGNVVVSLSALVVPDQQTTIQGYFQKFEYGCRFLTWRLFYQEAYNQWLAQQPSASGKPGSVEDGAKEGAKDGAKAGEGAKAPSPPTSPAAEKPAQPANSPGPKEEVLQ